MLGHSPKKLRLAVGTHSALKLFERYSGSIDANQRGSNISDKSFKFNDHLARDEARV